MVERAYANAVSSGGDTASTHALYGHDAHAAVVELQGALRYASASAFRKFIDDVIAKESVDVVMVDLSRASFVDSTGLGLLARIGQCALARTGRRAVLVCPGGDVATTLRSAAFEELFVMVDELPSDGHLRLEEVPLVAARAEDASTLGRAVLDAHRDLAALSARNRDEYRDVIAALEAELRPAPPSQSK